MGKFIFPINGLIKNYREYFVATDIAVLIRIRCITIFKIGEFLGHSWVTLC